MKLQMHAKLCLCIAMALQGSITRGRAQTAAEPAGFLRGELVGRQLFLRNLSAATDIRGSFDGAVATLDPPSLRILAVLSIQKIQMKGSVVTIEAARSQILRDKDGKIGLSGFSNLVTLTLKLKGDPAVVVQTLRDSVFLPNLKAALAAVPSNFQALIPPQLDVPESPPPTPVLSETCDCADTNPACLLKMRTGIEPPKILSRKAPHYTDMAAQKKIHGAVRIGLQLNDAGLISDEWLIRELDYGLDEEAATAVHEYKFAPATCDAKPIPFRTIVDVNFEIR